MIKRFLFFVFTAFSTIGASAQSFQLPDAKDISLFPETNAYRNVADLSGVWNFKVDSTDVGEKENWFAGLKDYEYIAVPGSWNEQIAGLRDYMGIVWYEQTAFVPEAWRGQRIYIRVGSASYAAKLWINGKSVGMHEGGNLPFAFDITDYVQAGEKNRIDIRIENLLRPDRVPVGGENVTNTGGGILSGYPLANFDFFPYGGLQRAVLLYSLPKSFVQDITVNTSLSGAGGLVDVTIEKKGNAGNAVLSVGNSGKTYPVTFKGNTAHVQIKIPDAHLWSPDDPFLYRLTVSLKDKNKTADTYSLPFGVRTISVTANQILLNGKPINLRGFGKHEDFPVFGRGTALPVMIKDFSLLKWIGANSFRTSHYPYSEQYMDMADEQGIMVIDETPSVGLFFDDTLIGERKRICERFIREMVARDKNHPSVIMWSLANEPIPAQDERRPDADAVANNTTLAFFKDLFKTVKSLDSSRPATTANLAGAPVRWLGLADVVCINRYYGWYTSPGDLNAGVDQFSKELDYLHKTLNKPIIITEFGADAYPGIHALEPEMFSEEYQTEFIRRYLDAADSKPFVAGTMVWAFADFKTSQGTTRFAGMNFKGVFTRDRKPKMAAEYLRKRWHDQKAR